MRKPIFLFCHLLLWCSVAAFAKVTVSKSSAMNVAAQYIGIMSQTVSDGSWNSSAVVTDAFPLYLDGIDAVSYWDCKVKLNGVDAGYIIVNANQTDVIIPECSPSGKTISESFQALFPSSSIKINRYGPAKYLVLNSNTNNVVALEGFAVPELQCLGITKLSIMHPTSDFSEAVSFRTSVITNGCCPAYTTAQLTTMYADQSLAKQATPTSKSVFLKHSVKSGSKTYYTPRWNQITIEGGHSVGCANTAWAIVYGYWNRFKGKTMLFDGITLTDAIWNYWDTGSNTTQVANCMKDCFNYNKSFGVITGASATWPGDVPNGIQYAMDKGYINNSICTKKDDGVINNFNAIYSEITNDRPVILYYATGSTFTIGDHYIVIEGAMSTTGQSIGLQGGGTDPGVKIALPNMQYLVNYGWGEDSKWITNGAGWCHDYYTVNVGDPSSFNFYANTTKGKLPLSVTFNVVDKTGRMIVGYVWSFGDGTSEPSGKSKTITHIYKKPGSFDVGVAGIAYPNTGENIVYSKLSYIKVYRDITPIVQLLLND